MEPVTKNIPALALRGLVVFPRLTASFDLERLVSMRALERAMEGERELFVVTQREVNVDLPQESDLYAVGTLVKISQVPRVSDHVIRVIVEGKQRARLRRLWVLLAFLCAAANLVRLPAGSFSGGETGAAELVFAVESRMNANPGALYLFDYFSQGAPFVSRPGRDAFGLNDGAAKSLGHGRVVAWLRDECAKRPVYVVACSRVKEPILDDGIALVPEGEPVEGTVARVDGKTFGTAAGVSRDLAFTFLRVRPAGPRDYTSVEVGHSPFGLAPGAWDEPRRGREGRWACDGAAFWAPVPAPGSLAGVMLDLSWWTRDGSNAPPQRLRLEPPFPGWSTEIVLEPGPDFRRVKLAARRDADDAEPRPATGLYRIRAAERYDEKGFPLALAVQVRSIYAGFLIR